MPAMAHVAKSEDFRGRAAGEDVGQSLALHVECLYTMPMTFEWDEAKNETNIAQRVLDLDAPSVFSTGQCWKRSTAAATMVKFASSPTAFSMLRR